MHDDDFDDGFLHAGTRHLISDWDLDQLGDLLLEWEDREANLTRIKRVTASIRATLETRRAA